MAYNNKNSAPHIFGTPGGSLHEMSGRASQAQIDAGRRGEVMTASVLDSHCRGSGPTVLHDLSIPLPNILANIDHVVVSGSRVTIVDSKYWRPGRYWTLFGKTRQGFTRVLYADKRTMYMAYQSLEVYLRGRGAKLGVPVIVVWPSSNNYPLNLRWYRPLGARAIAGRDFTKGVGSIVGNEPADPHLVAALRTLLKTSPTRR